MNNLNKKKTTLGIILGVVLLMSVGFAVYSTSLTIKSTASVTPDASNFSVVFSKSSTKVDAGTISEDASSTTTGGDATIDGTTISDLSASFKSLGDKVVYKFYVYNAGIYEAYLNSITFIGEKTCTPAGEGTSEMVNTACDSIKMTVQVGDIVATGSKGNITGSSIKANKSTPVTVTLEYSADGILSDEPFTVNFSDVSLYYATAAQINEKEETIYPDDGTRTTLVQHITNLYAPNSTAVNNGITYNIDTTNGIIDDGLGGTVESGGNLRYYGANPDNYIDIGDEDENGNPILWRIIGLFETKHATEELPCNVDSDSDGHFDNCASDKLVKIIRNDSIGKYSWDYTSTGEFDTNWSDSTLQIMLNGAYYNSTTTDFYNYVKDQNPTATTVDFTNTGLSLAAQSKIENTLWNLGGHNSAEVYSNEMYGYERGTTVVSGNPTEWVGKVGLMYPSDYVYATDLTQCSETLKNYSSSACYTNDWLYSATTQRLITPRSTGVVNVFNVTTSGASTYNSAFYANEIRPTLYLKSDVSIVGEGTTLGINYKIVE